MRGFARLPTLGLRWLRSVAAGEPPGPRGPSAVKEVTHRDVRAGSMHERCLGWGADRVALFRYRLVAARYGLRIRLMRPFGDVVGVAGLLLGVLPFAAVVSEAWRAYGVLLVGAMVVTAWPFIRWLGSISAIMRAAAASEEGTRQIFIDMRTGMASSAPYVLLRRIYAPLVEDANASLEERGWPCLLEFAGNASTSPAAVENEFAAVVLRTDGLADLTSLLGNLISSAPDSRRAESRAESRQRLMRRWRSLQSAGQPMDDEGGRNYCLAEVRLTGTDKAPQLSLDLGVAEYGQVARTSEALINEFAVFAFLLEMMARSHAGLQDFPHTTMRPRTALRCMPWRNKAHNDAGSAADLFLRPRHRAAGLGVAVATVMTADDERQVFVGERSGDVGTYPNVMHIIPAGNCNTHGTQRLIERGPSPRLPSWYLRTIMRGEFLEEWFNDEELEVSRFPNWAERVDQGWAARVNEITPITLTGVAFDLLNLRPEVGAVVEVAMKGNEVLNWEFESGSPPEEWPLRSVGSIRTSSIVQAGAAVLLLARDAILENNQGVQEQSDHL